MAEVNSLILLYYRKAKKLEIVFRYNGHKDYCY